MKVFDMGKNHHPGMIGYVFPKLGEPKPLPTREEVDTAVQALGLRAVVVDPNLPEATVRICWPEPTRIFVRE